MMQAAGGACGRLCQASDFPPPSCSLFQPHFVGRAVSSNSETLMLGTNVTPSPAHLLKGAGVALRLGKVNCLLSLP